MGNGSSKAVEADHSIENLEFNSDEHVGNWSQVPNNSPASTKIQNTIPIIQPSQSEDTIERDEGPLFRTGSSRFETPDLAAPLEQILDCARLESVELSSQRVALASAKEFPFAPQSFQVKEKIPRALDDLSLQVPPPTVPTVLNTNTEISVIPSDIDPDIPASFKLSTLKKDEQRNVMNQLPVFRTKLKPHAPEFIPRRDLYDNVVSIAATFSDITNCSKSFQSISAETQPTPQRQSVFEGRDLPPHLSFRDANHLYRPILIQAPLNMDHNELDAAKEGPTSLQTANFVSPLPSETANLTPPMEVNECNIFSAATYAEATNLAIQYPEIASEILVQPLSSVTRGSSLQGRKQKIDAPSRHKNEYISRLAESAEAKQLPIAAPLVATHTSDAPNWAAASLPPVVDQSRLSSEEPRKHSRNRRGKNETNFQRQSNGVRVYERWDPRNHEGRTYDHVDHSAGSAASEFHQPPPHQQQSFKASNATGSQSPENVEQKALDATVALSYPFTSHQQFPAQMRGNFADTPIGRGPLRTGVPSDALSCPSLPTSGLTVEQEASKLLAMANMYNIDLADLLRLVHPSGSPGTKVEGQQKDSFLGQSAPLHEVHARMEVIDERFWNTPPNMLPENSWRKSPFVNTPVTSPSSVFVPTYTATPVSTHGHRNISGEAVVGSETVMWNEPIDSDRISAWSRRESPHATFANSSSNSHAGNARSRTSTGDRREPWSRQQASRVGTKYNQDGENKAAFAVVDKLEEGRKEVLRHGTHISSKATSPCALANTNHHAEQMRINGGFGGYGTFTPAARRNVGQNQSDGWHQNVGDGFNNDIWV